MACSLCMDRLLFLNTSLLFGSTYNRGVRLYFRL